MTTIIKEIQQYCKRKNLTIDEIIDPITELACSTRDGLISYLRFTKGLKASEIAQHVNVPISYVMEVIRP